MICCPVWICTVPWRSPIAMTRGKSSITCCGEALVARSQSLGIPPRRRSRSAPPTSQTSDPMVDEAIQDLLQIVRNKVQRKSFVCAFHLRLRHVVIYFLIFPPWLI